MPFSPKAQELQICSKQASIHELSTPTNKLATYFGDDKPTSRSVLSDKPLEIKPVIRRVAQCWYWIGIGFACVKHCETYRARGFTAANQGSSSRINHCEGAIIAAISHDEQALPRDGRTGEQQLQMHVQQLQMDVQLCKYVCDNGFAHGATWKFKEQDGILVDLLINPTMHHFGEDGILELLHFGEDGARVKYM